VHSGCESKKFNITKSESKEKKIVGTKNKTRPRYRVSIYLPLIIIYRRTLKKRQTRSLQSFHEKERLLWCSSLMHMLPSPTHQILTISQSGVVGYSMIFPKKVLHMQPQTCTGMYLSYWHFFYSIIYIDFIKLNYINFVPHSLIYMLFWSF
jgi:hypothetical protein